MVPLQKLQGIKISEEFRSVYSHHLDEEVGKIEQAYYELIKILNASHTIKVSQKDFTKKVYNYFFKILFSIINDGFDEPVSIKTCINDAIEYAIAEYLSVSIMKSIS